MLDIPSNAKKHETSVWRAIELDHSQWQGKIACSRPACIGCTHPATGLPHSTRGTSQILPQGDAILPNETWLLETGLVHATLAG